MKRNFPKSKSFTLIEILISVAIFVIVSVLVIASLALLVNSKSKTIGLNELRTEGGKILVEIQDMVQKGNGTSSTQPGVIVIGKAPCVNFTDGTTLGSYQTDYRGWVINRILTYDNKQVLERKAMYDNNGNQIAVRPVSGAGYVPINSDRVEIKSFVITGTYRSSACGTSAVSTNLKVTITLASKNQGTPSELTLDSVFNSQFPYPDRGFDSVPQIFY